MGLLTVLVSICLLHLVGSEAICSDKLIRKRSSDPDLLCEAHASRLNPAGFIKYANGSCLLLGVCREGSMWPFPVYRRPSPERRVLLLRTLASEGISPYYLLQNRSESSDEQLTDTEVAQNKNWFKSPLLRSPALTSIMSQVELQLYNPDGNVVVRLEFSVSRTDGRLEACRWFQKNRLLDAYPWSYIKMRRARYNVFKPTFQDSRVRRRFHINTKFNGCPNDVGYLSIPEKTYCWWENDTDYKPPYIWAIDGDGPGRMRSQSYEASEFRLYGRVSPSTPLYLPE